MNVPRLIGAVVSSEKASLRECEEYYSVEDLYDIYEIIVVDAENARRVSKATNRDQ